MRALQFVLFTAAFLLIVFAGDWMVSREIALPSWVALHSLALLLFAAAFILAGQLLAFSSETRWPSASWRAVALPKVLYVNACYAPIVTGYELHAHGTSGYATEAGVATVVSIVLALTLGPYSLRRRQRERDSLARSIAAGEVGMEFVLFLRPFSLERIVRISEPYEGSSQILASAHDPVSYAPVRNVALDTAIASALDGVPTVSLGWQTQPIGTGRVETSDDTWVQVFEDLAGRAAAIVFFPHRSPGTMDELAHLSSAGHLHKTTLVCPPSDGSLGEAWRRTIDEAARIGLAFPPYDRSGFMFRCTASASQSSEIALSMDWSPGSIRSTVLDAADTTPRALAHNRPRTRRDLEPPVLDPAWEPLFEYDVPPVFEPIFGPSPAPEAKNPLQLVQLSLVARLSLQAVVTQVLLRTVVAVPILLHLLDASIFVTLAATAGIATAVLFLCVVMNHVFSGRRLAEWDDRDAIVASRIRLAPIVKAGTRAALAVAPIAVAVHASSLGLLYLSFEAWSWAGPLGLLVALVVLRPLPFAFTFRYLSALQSSRREATD